MDKHLDWTYDKVAYAGLPDVVKDIHNYGQKYMIIVVWLFELFGSVSHIK